MWLEELVRLVGFDTDQGKKIQTSRLLATLVTAIQTTYIHHSVCRLLCVCLLITPIFWPIFLLLCWFYWSPLFDDVVRRCRCSGSRIGLDNLLADLHRCCSHTAQRSTHKPLKRDDSIRGYKV